MQIRKVETISVKIPIRHATKLGVGALCSIDNVIIRLHTDEEVIGIGESSPWPVFGYETQESIKTTIDKYLSRVLIGEDCFDVEKIMAKMDKTVFGNSFAKAGIEMAIYDLIGKILKVPTYRVLGGLVREKIPLSFSVANQDIEADINEMKYLSQEGIKIFKIKTGVLPPDKDVERIAAIRSAFPDDVCLRVDANQGWTREVALRTIKKIEKYELDYVEQPLPYWDIAGMAEITKAIDTPISADESVSSIYDAFKIAKMEAADIISVKIMKFGGLANSKKIAAIAESAGLPCYAGAMWESGVGMAAALHLATSTRNITYGSDCYVPNFLMKEDIIVRSLEIRDGFIYVPRGSGLGVALDEKKVEKYRVSMP